MVRQPGVHRGATVASAQQAAPRRPRRPPTITHHPVFCVSTGSWISIPSFSAKPRPRQRPTCRPRMGTAGMPVARPDQTGAGDGYGVQATAAPNSPRSLMFITPAALELDLLWPLSLGGEDERPWTAESTLESGSVMMTLWIGWLVKDRDGTSAAASSRVSFCAKALLLLVITRGKDEPWGDM